MASWGEGALLTSGAPVTVPRDPARDDARRELLNPVYHQHDPSLLQQAMTWIQEQLGHAMEKLGSVGGNGVVGLLLFLAVAALVVAAVWWRLGAPRRQARSAAALFTTDGPRTADQHRSAAAAHAAAGEWAAAVREQMRALVRSLEERTVLDVRPGRTADEAAAEAGRALPAHATALAAAARTFDDIAYGEQAADQAAYQSLLDLDRALRQTRPVLVPTGGGAV
ncbi:DUF4129 domain-containing protein [Kitasatospora sp. GP82]|uniref:DUF4129 domain-containing protein n=1 Tax=Kitasatospora sp. GP82 TaxID=3035089 RepID=UPI002472F3C4|nr:DUF4129 domain-containing protein [Kitasatospora sp. GP82]MDH6126723.1 hypothetical protein [Kitasatospora sp. GP82]